ncbi:hypothetical protein M3P21_06455 [Ruegeria sp. 2012CJ41-6]|uniref:Lipoprotein n=1 Tax=Ruegeria spongiae TaxID=2942209 RepID=A0ABT0Q012_9RHOB|nr:hypothetical protein [Ruegeria spongiae]MCL6283170.1 hypothetical protein [Ruegeria spongiae]
MYSNKIVLALAACAGLSACGDNTTEQVLYGGAAGAAGAAVLDTNVVAGAAVGAGANVLYCKENPHKC